MKLLKKAGAVLLALTMIAVMLPQMGNKVVKAAGPSQTAVWTATTADSTGIIQTVGTSTANNTKTDPEDGTKYTKAFKTQSSTYFNIVVPEGKFVKVSVVAVANKTDGTAAVVQLDSDASTNKTITAQSNGTTADKVVMAGHLTAGTHKLAHSGAQLLIFKIVAEVYDNEADVPADAVVSKVKVSGTVKSSISLANGQIKLGLLAGDLTLKPGTTDEYTYELMDVEGDGAEYMVSIIAPEVTKSLKNIDSTSFGANGKIQVGSEDKVADFTLKFIDLDGLVWDFTNTSKNWQSMTYENNEKNPSSGTYKGLTIDATANTAKFDVQSGRIQINEGTKVNIPVSGWGTVTCTFTGKVPTNVTTLGDTVGESKATMTYNYQNAESVELSIGAGNTGLYLTKIEVVPDTNPAVKTIGASVRQEAAEWGNGIRFGGQLDLTKVDKATCTSGTLIGLAATVGDDNKMTLENVGTTCINVVRTTFIEETDATLDYAAALINIPETNLDTSIVARPYVTVNGITYYGDQIATTYNNATKIVNEQ